jgi:hypothetical protein
VALVFTVPLVGVTAMLVGTVSGTVMTAVLLVSDGDVIVAVTFVVPAKTPVTNPDPLTVAFVASELCHALTGTATAIASAFATIACICCVAPTTTVALVGVIAIVLGTRSETVRTAVLLVRLGEVNVAVIFVDPNDTAVTNPALSTVATPGLLECHALTLWPGIRTASGFNTEANNCTDVDGSTATVLGLTTIDVGVAFTETGNGVEKIA